MTSFPCPQKGTGQVTTPHPHELGNAMTRSPVPCPQKTMTRHIHRPHILLGGWGFSKCRVFPNSSKAGRRASNPGFALQIALCYLELKTTGLCWRSGSVDTMGGSVDAMEAGHREQSQGSPKGMFTPGRWGPLTLTHTHPNHSWGLINPGACGEGPCPAEPSLGWAAPRLPPVPSLPDAESQAPTGVTGPGPLLRHPSHIVRVPSDPTVCTGHHG